MLLHFFLFFYSCNLILILLKLNIFFVNEEFLISFSLIIFFILLYINIKNIINLLFFFKVNTIYLNFVELINLNIAFHKKANDLISIYKLKSNNFLNLERYVYYYEILNKTFTMDYLNHLSFYKTFINYCLFSIFKIKMLYVGCFEHKISVDVDFFILTLHNLRKYLTLTLNKLIK